MKLNLQNREAKILQKCLEALASGEDPQAILEQYSQNKAQLRAELQAAGWLMDQARLLDPDPEFIQRSRRRLEKQISADCSTWQRFQRILRRYFSVSSMQIQAAVIAVLVLVFLNVVAQVFFLARTALPGDFLFPIKLIPEHVRLFFIHDPVDEMRFNEYLTQKRAVELQELLIEGRYEDLPLGVTLLQQNLFRAQRNIYQIARRDPQMAQSLQQELNAMLQDQVFILSLLAGNVPGGLLQVWDQTALSFPH